MPAAAPHHSGPSSAPARCDVAVVGGGILGLAVARELTRRKQPPSVCVLEREHRLAAHQSGHSSGVIHAGIYYRPGSLKARLCVQGARELYEYCTRNEIPHERCGEVILATTTRELGQLAELERRGTTNGVRGLRRVAGRELARLEPNACALEGLYSPDTGIVDFAAVAHAYARDIEEAGGTIATGWEISGLDRCARGLRLSCATATVEAGHAIFCAGAWADRLAIASGAGADPRIVPFRGAYLRLRPDRRHLVHALIYPVPDPSLPFLGVHLSRHIDGEVLIGPTALMVGARDAYRLATVRGADLLDTLAWPQPSCTTPPRAERWCGPPPGTFPRCAPRTCSRGRREFGRRRSAAMERCSTTSSSRPPSGRCMCAMRPPPARAPHLRSRGTWRMRRANCSTWPPERHAWAACPHRARAVRRRQVPHGHLAPPASAS